MEQQVETLKAQGLPVFPQLEQLVLTAEVDTTRIDVLWRVGLKADPGHRTR